VPQRRPSCLYFETTATAPAADPAEAQAACPGTGPVAGRKRRSFFGDQGSEISRGPRPQSGSPCRHRPPATPSGDPAARGRATMPTPHAVRERSRGPLTVFPPSKITGGRAGPGPPAQSVGLGPRAPRPRASTRNGTARPATSAPADLPAWPSQPVVRAGPWQRSGPFSSLSISPGARRLRSAPRRGPEASEVRRSPPSRIHEVRFFVCATLLWVSRGKTGNARWARAGSCAASGCPGLARCPQPPELLEGQRHYGPVWSGSISWPTGERWPPRRGLVQQARPGAAWKHRPPGHNASSASVRPGERAAAGVPILRPSIRARGRGRTPPDWVTASAR